MLNTEGREPRDGSLLSAIGEELSRKSVARRRAFKRNSIMFSAICKDPMRYEEIELLVSIN